MIMLRKIFSLILLVTLSGVAALADSIITVDANEISCKVVEIRDDIIKYRKPGEGFDREISPAKVFKIKYDNGEEELIDHQNVPSANQQASASSQQAANVAAPQQGMVAMAPHNHDKIDFSDLKPAEGTYQIGDWFSENGLEGVVIAVDKSGKHGILLHPKKIGSFTAKYSPAFFTGDNKVVIGMNYVNNGYNNYLALGRFLQNNPRYTLADFPMQKAVSALGEGWYIPSVGEMQWLLSLENKQFSKYSGNCQKYAGKDVKAMKVINTQIKSHGGNALKTDLDFITSTESWSNGGASAMYQALYGDPMTPQVVVCKVRGFSPDTPVDYCRDGRQYGTRAFHRF